MSSAGTRRHSIAVSAVSVNIGEHLTQSVCTMEEINNIEIGPCTDSDYLKPFRVHYNQVSSFVSPKRWMEDAGCWRLALAQPPFIFAASSRMA